MNMNKEEKKLIDWLDKRVEAAKTNEFDYDGLIIRDICYIEKSIHINNIEALSCMADILKLPLDVEVYDDGDKQVSFNYKGANVFCLCRNAVVYE